MAKKPTNHRKTWTTNDVKGLRKLADQNTPTRIIGLKLGRTPTAIESKASLEKISLEPHNQSPYNRRTK